MHDLNPALGRGDGPHHADRLVPGLTILAHPHAGRVGDQVLLPELSAGATVLLSRLSPDFVHPRRREASSPLGDPYLSRTPLQLSSGTFQHDVPGVIVVQRLGSRTKTRIDGSVLQELHSIPFEHLHEGVVFELGRRIVLLLGLLDPEPPPEADFGLAGHSPAMAHLHTTMQRALERAAADAAQPQHVLYRGEIGSGRSQAARALHSASARAAQPFVVYDLASEPTSSGGREARVAQATGGSLLVVGIDNRTQDDVHQQLVGLRAHAAAHDVMLHLVATYDPLPARGEASANGDGGPDGPPTATRVDVPALRHCRADFGRMLYRVLRAALRATHDIERLEREPPWPSATTVAKLARHSWPGNRRELQDLAMELAQAPPIEAVNLVRLHLERAADDLERLPTDDVLANGPVAPRIVAASATAHASRPTSDTGITDERLVTALHEHSWVLEDVARALDVDLEELDRLIQACPRITKLSELSFEDIRDVLSAASGNILAAALALGTSPHDLRRWLGTRGETWG
ncbi:MAG: sigma 54-interacting transcriptional regulator [Acidobacteriota bacterium]